MLLFIKHWHCQFCILHQCLLVCCPSLPASVGKLLHFSCINTPNCLCTHPCARTWYKQKRNSLINHSSTVPLVVKNSARYIWPMLEVRMLQGQVMILRFYCDADAFHQTLVCAAGVLTSSEFFSSSSTLEGGEVVPETAPLLSHHEQTFPSRAQTTDLSVIETQLELQITAD